MMLISGLFTKKFERFPDYQGDYTKRNFLSRTDVFLKGPLFSKSTLKLVRFDTKFVVVRKILLSASRQGSLGSSVSKSSLCPALSLSVSLERQLTMKARMNKISVDVAVTINQCSLIGNQQVRLKYLKPKNFRLISFEDLKNRSFK